MMETRTREKGTIDCGLQGSMGTLDDVNPTRLSKQSQGCPLTGQLSQAHTMRVIPCWLASFSPAEKKKRSNKQGHVNSCVCLVELVQVM